ncbi:MULTISPECIES: histidine phosphatase family protein [unclassified Enterococcus]|uniref:histidine phosphatase family protein n=1 Tax=unclassified Enterococcus TaxID=2608891 RepID=UPI00155612E3|nr:MULTISPECIES: histidine phosphatase family protein [unclassified Enterococcus]MBS7577413.1 histidine phosphatase family protein [Enterococcus sp. MMGLQ5-2]MBS7584820.1 histidine phosphatase family protein [Enterococcus sp. MMGLQ5-1]NPD12675.1 histidine phosphatase family protein [Enterococcus sp. MMGLQ5-1]NPD37247.1 histidine phosphatase family protein [Enterococcus sp. MMGLQ5-2]
MELFFTRHGKTEWNLEKRLQGKTGDSPLLPESLQEIERLGAYLKQFNFKRIYTSPSLRARRTAEIINHKRTDECPIILSEGLREWGLGDLEGVLIEQAKSEFPNEMRFFREDLSKFDPSAFRGETVTQVLDRMSRTVQTAMLETKGNILFVSHGAALTATINYLTGASLSQLRARGGLNNNTLSILTATKPELPFELKRWNDDHFLKQQSQSTKDII